MGVTLPSPQGPPILIVGAHRSGTSVTAECLAGLGVFLGARLDDHHESTFMQRIGRRLTAEAGAHWTTPRIAAETIASIPQLDRFCEPLSHRLRRPDAVEFWGPTRVHQPYAGPWGWKDPRSVYLLPIWRQVFPDLHIVWVRRDPRDAALSLHRRTVAIADRITKQSVRAHLRRQPVLGDAWRALTLDGALEIILDYRELQEQAGDERNNTGCVIEYESLISEPFATLTSCAEALGLDPSAEQMASATSRVEKKMAKGASNKADFTEGLVERVQTLGYP